MNRHQNPKGLFVVKGEGQSLDKKYTCHVCWKRFRSKSRFDTICDLCWAENDMQPQVYLGRFPISGRVN